MAAADENLPAGAKVTYSVISDPLGTGVHKHNKNQNQHHRDNHRMLGEAVFHSFASDSQEKSMSSPSSNGGLEGAIFKNTTTTHNNYKNNSVGHKHQHKLDDDDVDNSSNTMSHHQPTINSSSASPLRDGEIIAYQSATEISTYQPSKYLHEYSTEYQAAYQPEKERSLGYIHVDAESRFAAHRREFKRAARLVNGIQKGKLMTRPGSNGRSLSMDRRGRPPSAQKEPEDDDDQDEL